MLSPYSTEPSTDQDRGGRSVEYIIPTGTLREGSFHFQKE